MKTRLRKILVVAAAVVLVLTAFAFWYRMAFSMSVARAFDVQGSAQAPRILIATQGSAFKDAVVAGLVTRLKSRDATISVMDVSALNGTADDAWDVVVLIHTWEMRKPPAAVRTFVDRVNDKRKLIVLTTSGQGSFRLEGIDAISSASRDEDVPAKVEALVARIDAVLAHRAQTPSDHGT